MVQPTIDEVVAIKHLVEHEVKGGLMVTAPNGTGTTVQLVTFQ
jgi:hypothetical protein